MGNKQSSVKKANFEDIQQIIKTNNNSLLINTLNINEQNCLIKGTIAIDKEEMIINKNLNNLAMKIIVYDKNSSQDHLYKKYHQLINLGFYEVYVYPGGLFEWLLLQDIYGSESFPTSTQELDILKFKPRSAFSTNYLMNID
jgi:hypothetical protein